MVISAFLFLATAAAQDAEELVKQLQNESGQARKALLLQLMERCLDESPDQVVVYGEEMLNRLEESANAQQEIQTRLLLSKAMSTLGDAKTGLEHAIRAVELADEIQDLNARSNADYHIALARWYLAELPEAIQSAERACATQRKQKTEAKSLAKSLTLLGAIHRSRSAYDKSLRCHFESLEISKRIADDEGIARGRNNIGLIFWRLERFDEALENLSAALPPYRRLNQKSKLVSVLNNLGLIHIELEQPKQALTFLEEGLELHKTLPHSRSKPQLLSNMGFAHETLGDDETALKYHHQALAIRQEMNDHWRSSRSLGCIGMIHARASKHEQAIDYFRRGIVHAETAEAREEQAALQLNLAESFEAMGDHKQALGAMRRHYEIDNELDREETARKIAELEAAVKLKDNERNVQELKRNQAQQALELDRQQNRQLFLTLALLLLFVTAVSAFLYSRARSLKSRQQSYQELQTALGRLADSEQRYRSVFEDAIVPKFLIDLDEQNVIDANASAAALCRSTPSQLRGVKLKDLSPDWIAAALSGTNIHEACQIAQWLESTGERRRTELRTLPLLLNNRSCAVATLNDVTERHRLEEENLRIGKLESLGQLAGGIAHDFNNTLTAVLGYVSLASYQVDDQSNVSQLLEKAESASKQAEHLTSELLAFAKGGLPDCQPQNVEKLLRESVNLGLAGSNVRVDFELAPRLWAIHADAGQFKQAIGNLVINAKQAMKEGGRILVRAQNTQIDIDREPNSRPRKYVQIEIRDFGPGIPVAIQDKVMTPNFTTKKEGSGLGLSTAFAIILRHHGRMEFESAEGQGTCFSIHFPSTNDVPVREINELPRDIEGHGSVLVMDDDPQLQTVLSASLTELGYSAEIVDNGEEALSRWFDARNAGHPFDIVIMDLTIPGGMGGQAAMAELKNRDPSAIGIVMSGYKKDPVLSNYREAGFAGALDKPFTISRLGQLLNGILRRKAK